MDKFELYMIDLMKDYSDRLTNDNNGKEVKYVMQCVLSELVEVFSRYEIEFKGNSGI